MSRDYKNIHPQSPISDNKTYYKAGLFLPGLFTGLCIAVAIYFYKPDPQQIYVTKPEVTVKEPPSELNKTPTPTFDFYQILPNMEVNIPEWEAEDNESIINQIGSGAKESERYILQIGSFRQPESANHVKEKLAAMAINADIQRVVVNGKDIRYRVRIGPYTDSKELVFIRQQLSKNNLDYILLKLKK